jgi:hypothetical protein
MSTKKKEEKYQPYLQEMIGQTVRVVRINSTPWLGKVITVLDAQTFLVADKVGGKHKVDMFDLRTPEYLSKK